MRILVACEYSAVVRDAFRARGHDAWSCDIEPTEGDPKWHHQGPVEQILHNNAWDMLIGFPPCTHLSVSGARWWPEKIADGSQDRAVRFFMLLAEAPIARIAIENPVGLMSTKWRKPDQIIHPWQFGHGEVKTTCLWLEGLPELQPTSIVDGRTERIHRMAPGPTRARERSRTYTGIAAAMADQWG